MKKNSLTQERGEGPLKDRKKPTEQVSWYLTHTIFVELFTVDLLKKKIKILSFVCAEIFTE